MGRGRGGIPSIWCLRGQGQAFSGVSGLCKLERAIRKGGNMRGVGHRARVGDRRLGGRGRGRGRGGERESS